MTTMTTNTDPMPSYMHGVLVLRLEKYYKASIYETGKYRWNGHHADYS
jgi:hypothetical protein